MYSKTNFVFSYYHSFDFFIILASEFGTTTSAWKAIMAEADASAEVHQTVHDELQNDLIPAIKSWQKAKYIKSMMHIKTTKDFDEEFKRVNHSFKSNQ
jgi:predicted double-glycine peptidase